MSDKGGAARLLGQNRTFQILGLEKDLNESPQIVNSPLKTEIKRADTAAFAFVEPTKDLNLAGGIGQNRKMEVNNTFQQNGIATTQPAKKGKAGQSGGNPLQNVGGAYNDPPLSAPRRSTASNPFDDDQTHMQPPPPNLYGDGQTGNAWRESISLEHSDGTEPPNGADNEALNQAVFGMVQKSRI